MQTKPRRYEGSHRDKTIPVTLINELNTRAVEKPQRATCRKRAAVEAGHLDFLKIQPRKSDVKAIEIRAFAGNDVLSSASQLTNQKPRLSSDKRRTDALFSPGAVAARHRDAGLQVNTSKM